jgi:hypothetical protein
MKQYYVYELINSLNGIPFYVGKGTGRRMYLHERQAVCNYTTKRSVHCKILNVLALGGTIQYKQIVCDSEQDAINYEIKLIKQYGRRDNNTGVLHNLTDGGEGITRSVISSKQAAEKNRGRKRSAAAIENMKRAQWLNIERNLKIYGQKTKPGSQERRIATITGYKRSLETRLKIKQALSKPVLAFKADTGEFVGKYASVNDCAASLNIPCGGVGAVARKEMRLAKNGKYYQRKTYNGFIFKYE